MVIALRLEINPNQVAKAAEAKQICNSISVDLHHDEPDRLQVSSSSEIEIVPPRPKYYPMRKYILTLYRYN